jgi:hypothetical protein
MVDNHKRGAAVWYKRGKDRKTEELEHPSNKEL